MEPAYRRVSARRILALAVAMGCHGVVLVVLLMPASPDDPPRVIAQMHDAQIKVRWIPSRSRAAAAPATVPSAAPTPISRARPSSSHATESKAARPTTPGTAPDVPSRLVLPNPLALPVQPAGASSTTADAGFHNRVHDAQHSRDVRGIPGSDRRIVPGIVLIDPRKQGVGSVLRNVQRLFGITQHACMDVDALHQLSPEELAARHLTQEDLDKQAEKYQCNEPLGQHF
ncbi:hypothetical protein [Dyella amyloliquefaciens]|uniref:hypothetical protein n=1 Tax=Dyella amyloliquefaciens TaxID=1770545 RepID=UPI00102E433D|nr:hypothetical protein [Dyella amyloliquefaciens]